MTVVAKDKLLQTTMLQCYNLYKFTILQIPVTAAEAVDREFVYIIGKLPTIIIVIITIINQFCSGQSGRV